MLEGLPPNNAAHVMRVTLDEARARAAAVVEVLATVRAAEAALEAKIVAGLEIPEFVEAILNSDRVVRID